MAVFFVCFFLFLLNGVSVELRHLELNDFEGPSSLSTHNNLQPSY